ncbi:MAG: hypothetical protein QXH07_07775 [Thermoplasmata archaeon]
MSKKICAIGTRYVALITGVDLADFGNSVICTDIDKDKIKIWNQYRVIVLEIIRKLMKSNFILDARNLLDKDVVNKYGIEYEDVRR